MCVRVCVAGIFAEGLSIDDRHEQDVVEMLISPKCWVQQTGSNLSFNA